MSNFRLHKIRFEEKDFETNDIQLVHPKHTSSSNYISLIVGNNGTGKSRILSKIARFFVNKTKDNERGKMLVSQSKMIKEKQIMGKNHLGIRDDLIAWHDIAKIVNIKALTKILDELYTLKELEERYNREFSLTLKNLKKFAKLANGKKYNFENDFYKAYKRKISKNALQRINYNYR